MRKSKLWMILFLMFAMVVQMSSFGKIRAEDLGSNHQAKFLDQACERTIEGSLSFEAVPSKKNIDLVIVQDASGSFHQTIGSMKVALKQVVDTLDDGDRAMLVTYQGGNRVVYEKDGDQRVYEYESWPAVNIQTMHDISEDLDSVKAAIDQIEVRGGTPTALGLKHVLDHYENTDPNRETVVLLVTDGIANVADDGVIYLDRYSTEGFREEDQDYERSINDALKYANALKEKGYYLVSTFIEDHDFLTSIYQYPTNYDVVGPYAHAKLEEMATSPKYYESFDNPQEFGDHMAEILSELHEDLTQNKLIFDLHEGYVFLDAKLYQGDELIADDIKLGTGINELNLENVNDEDYRLVYKIKEHKVFQEDKVAVHASLKTSDENIVFEDLVVEGNKNPRCQIGDAKISKTVNKKTDHYLENLNEEFQYTIKLELSNLYGLKELVIEDQLDPLLTILEDSIFAEVDGEVISGMIDIKDQRLRFIKTDNLSDLENKTVYLRFKAKIKDGLTEEDVLSQYETGAIPNQASFILNNSIEKSSETVYVHIPEDEDTTVQQTPGEKPAEKPTEKKESKKKETNSNKKDSKEKQTVSKDEKLPSTGKSSLIYGAYASLLLGAVLAREKERH